MANKISFLTFLKRINIKQYYIDLKARIKNNEIVLNLNSDELLQVQNSNLDCGIIFYEKKENMNQLTLKDLFDLIVNTKDEINRKIDNVKSELKSDINETNKRLDKVEVFIEEQKEFNKKQESFNQEIKKFMNKQESFNEEVKKFMNKQEMFNKEVIQKLDTHEKALKKGNLL